MYCRFSKKRGQVWLNKVTPVPTFSGEAVTSNAPSHQLDHAEWLGCKKTLQGHRKRQDSDRICQALISGTTFCVKRPVQIWNLAKQAEASWKAPKKRNFSSFANTITCQAFKRWFPCSHGSFWACAIPQINDTEAGMAHPSPRRKTLNLGSQVQSKPPEGALKEELVSIVILKK